MEGDFTWSGILKTVMHNPLQLVILIVLVVMSLYSLTIGVERFLYFRKMRKGTLKFLPSVTNALKNKDIKQAIDETRRPAHKTSHLAQVLAGGLHEFHNHEDQKDDFDIISSCGRALDRSSAITSADLRRGLAVLATVGASAPFVGLLGTVFGVINSFRGMATSGGAGLSSVSAGIAEALFMTGVGLAVAIPAVWLFNYFTNKIEFFEAEMSNSASELLDFFIRRIGHGAKAPAHR